MAKKGKGKAKKDEPVEEEDKDVGKKGGKKADKKKKMGWKEQLAEEEAEAKRKQEQEEALKNREPRFVVARHILLSDSEKAQEIYDQLYEEYKDEPPSKEFAKLAKEHSE